MSSFHSYSATFFFRKSSNVIICGCFRSPPYTFAYGHKLTTSTTMAVPPFLVLQVVSFTFEPYRKIILSRPWLKAVVKRTTHTSNTNIVMAFLPNQLTYHHEKNMGREDERCDARSCKTQNPSNIILHKNFVLFFFLFWLMTSTHSTTAVKKGTMVLGECF